MNFAVGCFALCGCVFIIVNAIQETHTMLPKNQWYCEQWSHLRDYDGTNEELCVFYRRIE